MKTYIVLFGDFDEQSLSTLNKTWQGFETEAAAKACLDKTPNALYYAAVDVQPENVKGFNRIAGAIGQQAARVSSRVLYIFDGYALTPADLAAAGYRIEHGREGDPQAVAEGLAGKYWWTFTRDGVADIGTSFGEWNTPEEAITDARENMAEEGCKSALGAETEEKP